LDLPATKEGHAISYALVEDSVAGYTSDVTGDIAKGFVVTNTHTVTPPPSPDPDPTIYTITYVLNGGSYNGSTDDIVEKYPAGTGILIHEAPTREGYAFDYWKGSAYQPGDVYTVTEDHTFVAQWKSNGEDAPTPTPDNGDNGDAPGKGANDNTSGPAGSAGTSPAASAGRTTSSAPLARTGDDSALALAGVAAALLGGAALTLARRRR
jgi:LPXTG-motif cell wall-anchored protein